MGANQLPSAAEMIDIHNAIVVIIVAVLGSVATMIGVGVGIFKWYLPNVFKHRDDARQLEIDGLRAELATKREADAVEIERDRMLPLMVENNQRLVDAMIKSKEADTAATLQRIELDKTTAAVLVANTNQITTHGDQLEDNTSELRSNTGKLEEVEKKLDKLYDRFMVIFPRETYLADLFTELKGVVEETKKACADTKRKGDSKPIPLIPPTPDPANILYDNVLPGDLDGKETDLPKAG